MAMVVKNNMSAVRTLNTLNTNSNALQKSLAKVSSGMKINSAQDDASGYAISERMRVQIRSLDQANQNTQNGSSMMKTAEGAVSSTVEILKSLKDKAINSANDTNTDSDRATIQKEIDQFIDQIDDNALVTFNGKYLVDGSKSQQGKATHTALTNQSLSTATEGTTKLTALANRNDENLEIESTDYVTASFVKNGKTYSTKFLVGNNTLDNVFGKMNEQYLTDNGKDITEANMAQAAFGGTAAAATAEFDSNLSDAVNAAAQTLSGLLTQYVTDNPASGTGANATANGVAYVQTWAAGVVSGIADGTAQITVTNPTAIDTDGDGTEDYSTLNVGSKNYVDAAIADTAIAAAKTDLDNAVAAYNAAVPTPTVTATYNAADGTEITKENADNYIMSDADVDAMASSYGVTRYDGEEDTTYAARILEAVVDKGTEAVAGTRGTAGNVTYADNTLNKASDNTGIGQTTAGSSVYFNPEDMLEYENGKVTGAMQSYDSTTGKGAAALQNGYDAYVADTSLGNGSGANIQEPYAKAVQIANHLSALNAKNAEVTGIVGTVTDGNSTGTAAYTLESTTDKSLIGVNSAGDKVYTADGKPGLTVTSNGAGVEGQISGVTISITDSQGNVKKAANASLDQFKTSIYAKNKSDANELSFQVGASANQAIAVGLEDMRSEALGLKSSDGTKVSVATQERANAAVAVFDNAINKALDQQTTIGAIEARLEYTSQNLTTSSENVQAAESTIRDADMAKEMTNYTKNNVLLQAAQSMLAQANQSSSAVLSLLQ